MCESSLIPSPSQGPYLQLLSRLPAPITSTIAPVLTKAVSEVGQGREMQLKLSFYQSSSSGTKSSHHQMTDQSPSSSGTKSSHPQTTRYGRPS